MQQDAASTQPVDPTATPAADTAALTPAAADPAVGAMGQGIGGNSDADALSQMGFSHLFNEMVSEPGEFAVSWTVLLTLVLMSIGSWYYTIVNILKQSVIRARADRV